MFNFEKKIGEEEAIFFGKHNGLHDTISVPHLRLEELYLQQMATDWAHNEFDYSKDREQLRTCPKGVRDLMLYNILFQWHLDSVAADNLFPLFAPFLTNSEANALFCFNDKMEYTHSKTYSEIIRQCMPDKTELDAFLSDIKQVRKRLSPVFKNLKTLKELGHKYQLGMVSKEECYPYLIKGLVTWWCMERIQFMASFPMTFSIVEKGWFQNMGNAVQKIMLDEYNIHAETMKYCLSYELSTKNGKKVWEEAKAECRKIVDSFVQAEKEWVDFALSDGRGVAGLSTELMYRDIEYNAAEVYEVLFGIKPSITERPLKLMEVWLSLDKTQAAGQEIASVNYLLGSVHDDTDGDL